MEDQEKNANAPTQTFGQKAVGINFNPSADNQVDRVKQIMANAIDEMNNFRKEIQDRDKTSADIEKIRLASIAITELQGAQMWAVKAITWKD